MGNVEFDQLHRPMATPEKVATIAWSNDHFSVIIPDGVTVPQRLIDEAEANYEAYMAEKEANSVTMDVAALVAAGIPEDEAKILIEQAQGQ